MNIIKTDKEILTEEEILGFIRKYETTEVPQLDKLWEYYTGKNTKILKRKITDPNNPDNRIPVSYGRKIITTFVGYAYRPRYITYKPIEIKIEKEPKEENIISKTIAKIKKPFVKAIETREKAFCQMIQDNFNMNNEHIKTSRAGRNTAIFGVAYEIVYIDTQVSVDDKKEIVNNNIPKFFSVDPRELILIYDYSPEPQKKIAIRMSRIGDSGKVEVYYKDRIIEYERINKDEAGNQIEEKLVQINEYLNFFEDIPVVAYYFGDEMIGLIEPVIPLIDAYDVLMSDSMNEFDRFAFAYLIMKKFGLTDQVNKKAPGMTDKADATLRNIKRKRVFEHLPEGADISFLTKDIPSEFIQYMSTVLREQIHIQSHVPDFTSEKMAGASGIAIQRLLFDFENVCSSAEADFDIGLGERIDLISTIYVKSKKGIDGGHEDIIITHKRNLPQNGKEFADLAYTMKQAGFSRYAIADVMPDDIIPDVEKELERQDEDAEMLLPDIENMGFGNKTKTTNDLNNQPDEIIEEEEI